MEMDLILQGAVAGVIAAVTATAILGVAKWVHQWWLRSQDVNYLRDLLVEQRKRVLEDRDKHLSGLDAVASANRLRAALYNNMIKKLGVVMEKWLVNLSHKQRKDIAEALDWYYSDELKATKIDGMVTFLDIPDGKWPVPDMPIAAAKKKFEKLQSIKWLKLEAYQNETV